MQVFADEKKRNKTVLNFASTQHVSFFLVWPAFSVKIGQMRVFQEAYKKNNQPDSLTMLSTNSISTSQQGKSTSPQENDVNINLKRG